MPRQGGQGKGKVKKNQKGFGIALMRQQARGSAVSGPSRDYTCRYAFPASPSPKPHHI